MEYTVQGLAKLAGVSTRTLRYYDEVGILKPARINSSGYRIYGRDEVDRLQQILFFRELGVGLDDIKAIITTPSFDGVSALKEHHKRLLEKRKQLDLLIENVEKTIAAREGRIIMTDKEKFEGFMKKLVDENEQKYGEEIREKYGNEAVDKFNSRFGNMSRENYHAMTELEEKVKESLAEAIKTGDPASSIAQKTADLHRQWLTYYWGEYNKEAHANLAQMYVCDERFKAYYDKIQPGAAEFLRDAIHVYTGVK